MAQTVIVLRKIVRGNSRASFVRHELLKTGRLTAEMDPTTSVGGRSCYLLICTHVRSHCDCSNTRIVKSTDLAIACKDDVDDEY